MSVTEYLEAARSLLLRRWQQLDLNPFQGQKGQDKWVIFKVLPFKRNGYFLDLAAGDGKTHSNSYVLERLFGWDGICIEPNPLFLERLRKERSCIVDNSVISSRRERVLFRIDNGVLGGIVAEDTDNSPRVRGSELEHAEIITLDAVPLVEVLERHHAPPVINYFSLDVEGSEERIIKTFDWQRYRFDCLTIERPTPIVNEVLIEQGYMFVKNQHFDTYYVHSSLAKKKNLKCQPFEQVPLKDW